MCMGHVQRVGDFRGVAADETRRGLISVMQESDFVDLIKLPRLHGDVCAVGQRRGRETRVKARRTASGKVEAGEEVASRVPVHLLRDNLAIPIAVERVDHTSIELGEIAKDGGDGLCRGRRSARQNFSVERERAHLEEHLQVLCPVQLLVDLPE